MKKTITLIISIIMAVGCCACSVSVDSPEGVVDGFFRAVKDCDRETLAMYMDNNDINTLTNNNLNEQIAKEIRTDLMDNLSWEITSIEENEDQTAATVTVSVTNADFSGALKAYKKEAVEYMLYNVYNDEVTKDVMRQECQSIFAQQIKNASEKKDNLVTKEIQVNLTKNESYTWDMEVTKEMTKAAIGGLKWPAK